jgi:hypothetical protein
MRSGAAAATQVLNRKAEIGIVAARVQFDLIEAILGREL